MSPNQEPKGVRHKKASLPQTDVPSYPLMEALRVPRALAAELGKQPATPLQVAKALGVAPTTGAFRTVTASSVAYGLTDGAAFAEKISLTHLGRRIVAPTADGDEAAGMLQAVMLPRVTRAFLQRYNGSRWPREDIGRNVLEDELDVHRDQSARALQLIHIDADSLGLLVRINDEEYVSLDTMRPTAIASAVLGTPESDNGSLEPEDPSATQHGASRQMDATPPGRTENRRVFITHGKNQKIVTQIKKLLGFGDLEPVVSVETQAMAKPVPDKVLDEMRSCSAAIVHVDPSRR